MKETAYSHFQQKKNPSFSTHTHNNACLFLHREEEIKRWQAKRGGFNDASDECDRGGREQ